jgi:acyl-CoA reductase-like NAD-dependent aldehyde dehydrogenase
MAQILIDGRLADSASGATVDVLNPANGRQLFYLPAGCDEDVDRAVSAARRAFEEGRWSDPTPSARKTVLHRLADLIGANAARLDALDAEEMGKPISTAFASATSAARLMRFCAESVDKVNGDVYVSDPASFATQRRVPRGVVAAVVPWNFPTFVAVLKFAPALAAGNCVVLKPSELSSRSALYLAQLALEAGLPPGVLNIVPGLGSTVGKALGLHMDVDMLTFTGSTAVGKLMLQYAGQSNMKVVVAECGGKSPHIVFNDGVDLDAAAESIAAFLLTNQGQICSVGSRVLVQRSIERDFAQKLAARMSAIVVGDPLQPPTTFGPLASARQLGRVLEYVTSAASEGAQLVTGGQQVLTETGGHFMQPTLFRNVSPQARIAREEIFGPVLAVTAFDDEAEAIRLANSSIYGLLAYVWTARIATGMRVAKAIRASVRVNAVPPSGEGSGHAASYEPARQSGIGAEGGLAGLESYMRRQTIGIFHG